MFHPFAQIGAVRPRLSYPTPGPFLPSPQEREAGRKHNQWQARRGPTSPGLVGALLPLPFYRAAHLTVGQAATRPLSVPGQHVTDRCLAGHQSAGIGGGVCPQTSPRLAAVGEARIRSARVCPLARAGRQGRRGRHYCRGCRREISAHVSGMGQPFVPLCGARPAQSARRSGISRALAHRGAARDHASHMTTRRCERPTSRLRTASERDKRKVRMLGDYRPVVGAAATGLLVWGGAAAQRAGQSRRLSFDLKARVWAGWTS